MDTETLRQFALFDGMSDEQLSHCADLFEPIKRLGGERVTKEDDFGYSLFLVIEGRLSVRAKAQDETLAEIGPGDHFGEVSLVTGQKRNATVTALETCHLAKIMVWDFAALTASHPVLAQRLQEVSDKRLNL